MAREKREREMTIRGGLKHSFFLSPELKGDLGWSRLNYAETFPLSPDLVRDTCERVSLLDLDEQGFIERYEKRNVPVVITDAQLEWQATRKWTVEVCLLINHI